MVSIRTKLLTVILLVGLVPLLLMGLTNMNKTTDILSSSIQESLNTIVESKEAALGNYFTTTEKAAHALATTDAMQAYAASIGGAEDMAAKEIARDAMFNFMESHWGVEYHHIFVADPTGKIVMSPNHGDESTESVHFEHNIADNTAFQKAAAGESAITDFSSWKETNHFHQILFYPVKDANGNVLAVLGYELMISHEIEILTENFKLGESGKFTLITLEGVPVVHLKEDDQTQIVSEGVTQANSVGSYVGRYMNSEGVEVIGFYQKDSENPWIYMAEVEAEEAFSSVQDIRSSIILGILVTAILAIIFALVLSNYLTKPIEKLTSVADKLTDGDFTVDVPVIQTKDEIGQLSIMTAMLVDTIKALKNKKGGSKK